MILLFQPSFLSLLLVTDNVMFAAGWARVLNGWARVLNGQPCIAFFFFFFKVASDLKESEDHCSLTGELSRRTFQ